MNPQEEHWRGEAGDAYHARSPGDVRNNVGFFTSILRHNENRRIELGSIVELGAGVGSNLWALRTMYPGADIDAVEINDTAIGKMPAYVGVHQVPITDWQPTRTYDLAFTKGVLIHIPAEDLPKAYDALWRATRRWILVAEYYNPVPIEVEYRGSAGLLWKRDFAGEMLARFAKSEPMRPYLQLKGYGFVWRSDPDFPQDDITWFLMEKQT